MLKLKIQYVPQGPVLSGHAAQMIEQSIPLMERRIAEAGLQMIHQRLGHVLKHPTGYYESRVVLDVSTTDVSVTDSGVIYGPWLEGISHRNTVTRFKGYHTFRTIAQDLDKKAAVIAEAAFQPTLHEIGGR